MLSIDFTPKFLTLLKDGISQKQVTKDILAGIIVGILALPLAIAFAIASGVSPEKGVITAIIAGLIISLLGGSRVQIGGPTGAFIVIVYGIVNEHGVGGLTIATFLAGIIIILMGVAKLGNYLKFIPYPLIVGFTSGIAVIIFSSQVNDFLGLGIDKVPSDFVEKWSLFISQIAEVNPISLVIGLFTVIVSINFRRITAKIPGSLVAIIFTTAFVYYFHLPVETIQTKFGEITSHLAAPTIPNINFSLIQKLLEPAIAIALLGSIESLLSAVVADGMIGGRHRPNMELVAQGIANIFSSVFGGIPATGAIARTATNIKNGGRTPIAGIVHAITLLLILLIFAPIAKLIPLSCLAGILVVVSWNMSEIKHFKSVIQGRNSDTLILLTTFFLTVFFDLILAIEIGMILSSFIFMKKMSETTTINRVDSYEKAENTITGQLFEEELRHIPQNTMLYEINGPLFFGASQKFEDFFVSLKKPPKVLIIRMRNVPYIDATGIKRLNDIYDRLLIKAGTQVVISGANREIRKELLSAGLYKKIGKYNILDDIKKAIQRAKDIEKLINKPI